MGCSRDENESSDRVLRRVCHAAGFEPEVLMRTDDLNRIHGLVAEGLGCTLVRRSSAVPRAVKELHRLLVELLP